MEGSCTVEHTRLNVTHGSKNYRNFFKASYFCMFSCRNISISGQSMKWPLVEQILNRVSGRGCRGYFEIQNMLRNWMNATLL